MTSETAWGSAEFRVRVRARVRVRVGVRVRVSVRVRVRVRVSLRLDERRARVVPHVALRVARALDHPGHVAHLGLG